MSNPAMEPQSELLPKDKHDVEAVEKLRKLESEQLAPILPELLEWIQDANWPIFQDVVELVLTVPELLVEPVCKILKTDDEDWKYYCLEFVVKNLPRDQQQRLMPEIERIAHNPTPEEMVEEIHGTAQEVLESVKEADVDLEKAVE